MICMFSTEALDINVTAFNVCLLLLDVFFELLTSCIAKCLILKESRKYLWLYAENNNLVDLKHRHLQTKKYLQYEFELASNGKGGFKAKCRCEAASEFAGNSN